MRDKHSGIFESPDDFFELDGNSVMLLSPPAAIAVCEMLSVRDVTVGRVEGGFWSHSKFEARLDCIWDSPSYLSVNDVLETNGRAIDFIVTETPRHNAFIITADLESDSASSAA
ncbi:MAG: colicin immunity protein [Pseudomonadota bacterium]